MTSSPFSSSVKHYNRDFRTSKCKNNKLEKSEMYKVDKLLICLNSLHYLKEKDYDCIVIDEIKSFLNQWFNNDTVKKKRECWHIFLRLLKKAKRIIFLDAFTSKITYDFIRELGEINNTIVYERPQETSNINVELLENVKILQYQIVQSLKENICFSS